MQALAKATAANTNSTIELILTPRPRAGYADLIEGRRFLDDRNRLGRRKDISGRLEKFPRPRSRASSPRLTARKSERLEKLTAMYYTACLPPYGKLALVVLAPAWGSAQSSAPRRQRAP